MKRNPHPARRSRIATLGISASAFTSIVTSLVWNTHQAELVINVNDSNAVLVEPVTSVPGSTTQAEPVAGSVNPVATITPTAPKTSAAPAKKSTTTTVEPATPSSAAVTPAVPATAPAPAVVAPAAPAPAPAAAVYTCMSPGGQTENPSGSGSCPNAKYGYTLTQI